MRALITILALATLAFCFSESGSSNEPLASFQTASHKAVPSRLRANSLCTRAEHIIFSCRVKPAANRSKSGPVKVVSLCASTGLDREHGYLQYRYGLPGKIELEFPESRIGTQQRFHYTHYFRFQVDLTEISFNIDGYQYSVFDDYNGEEKPAVSTEGVSVTAPGKEKEVTFSCLTRAQADYSALVDVLNREQ